MADKNDDKKTSEEEKLVVVGDGAETSTETLEEQQASDNKKDAAEASVEEVDERVGHEEDDDENAVEGETVEQKRERRRGERKRRRENDSRMRREVNFLRQRNEQLERQFSQTNARLDRQETATIDSRINGIDSQIRQAESIHAQAVEQQDGKTATEALRIKDELIEQKRQLTESKARPQRPQPQQQATSAPRPDVQEQANAWFKRNEDWFDPHLNDEVSHLVKVMEDRLSREGRLDPGTPEYWDELDRRVAKRFPDLAERDADDDDDQGDRPAPKGKNSQPPPKKKPSGPRFSVGGRERALGKNEVFINAERRRALEEAGVWDDPVTRERYLKAYQTYDSEARKNS